MARQLARVLYLLELVDAYLLRPSRWIECEVRRGNLAAGLPVPKLDGVLRPVGDSHGRDDVPARTRFRALRHPDLPVHVLGAEGEVVTLDAADDAAAEDGVRWVADLCRRLEIPSLRAYGVTGADLEVLVEKAAQASSMKANAIALTKDELLEIAARASV